VETVKVTCEKTKTGVEYNYGAGKPEGNKEKGGASMEEMKIEEILNHLEKRVAALERQVQEQPSAEKIANKIKETLKKEIDAAETIAY
jgi:hypothetical protein